MKSLLFGTDGTPVSSKRKNSVSGIERIRELGLGCMEIKFLDDVRMGEKTARKVHEAAGKSDVELSAHAPYYTDLNAGNEKLPRYIELILLSARMGSICGAKSVIIHAGNYLKKPQEAVYKRIKNMLGEIMVQLKNEGVGIELRVETTGKDTQFGDVKEVLSLTEVEGVLPCISFPHLYERTGEYNSREEFASVLEQVEDKLGREGLDNMYIHASGGEPQEKRYKIYVELMNLDFNYKELAQTFSDFDIKGMVVSGGPDPENDALRLKKEYDRISTL